MNKYIFMSENSFGRVFCRTLVCFECFPNCENYLGEREMVVIFFKFVENARAMQRNGIEGRCFFKFGRLQECTFTQYGFAYITSCAILLSLR